MSDLKVQGRLCEIFPEEAKTGSFLSRNFVIETDGQYPQFVQFQLVQDRCAIIDSHRIGDHVTVHFDLRGKKWQEKYITSLNAWKISGIGSGHETGQRNQPPHPETPIQTNVTASPAASAFPTTAQTAPRVEPPAGDDLPF